MLQALQNLLKRLKSNLFLKSGFLPLFLFRYFFHLYYKVNKKVPIHDIKIYNLIIVIFIKMPLRPLFL